MATIEDMIVLLPPERQAMVRRDMEFLKTIRLSEMTDAALGELYEAVGEEITRRDRLAE